MNAEPAARLLDISRLLSRIGRGPLTGVDRVEREYLRRLMEPGPPLFLLVRTRLGYLVLDSVAGEAILERTASGGGGYLALPVAVFRRAARDRSTRLGLGRMLRRVFPQGGSYLNVGHSNLTVGRLGQIRRGGLRTAVMIHDTIPLDHPEFCAPGTPARFERILRAATQGADLILCNSQATCADLQRHAGAGRMPEIRIAHLGVDLAAPDPGMLAELRGARPYFVMLGTIEPRKNHALALDIWERMAAEMPADALPDLRVIGTRGWADARLFARLDAQRAPDGPVHEMTGLSDRQVAAVLAGARALLMPSRAEGFGLPVAEAAARGVPVVATDLPAYREVVGDYPVYAAPDDMYSWQRTITKMAIDQAARAARQPQQVPGWTDHFKIVLNGI